VQRPSERLQRHVANADRGGILVLVVGQSGVVVAQWPERERLRRRLACPSRTDVRDPEDRPLNPGGGLVDSTSTLAPIAPASAASADPATNAAGSPDASTSARALAGSMLTGYLGIAASECSGVSATASRRSSKLMLPS
jgi:hypothetical protein